MAPAIKAFNDHMATLKRNVEETVSQETAQPLRAYFEGVAGTMRDMLQEATFIVSSFEQGDADKAGERMATMDRKYALLNEAIGHLEQHVDTIQEA